MRSVTYLGLALLLCLPFGGHAQAQDTDQDTEGLPRVLIIGDEVAAGYTPYIRTRLDGIAQVNFLRLDRSADGLDVMEEALVDDPWDVIACNVGLGDMALQPDGTPYADVATYEQNMIILVKRLVDTSPSFKVYVTTTPVPEGLDGWKAGDERAYNQAALRVVTHRVNAVLDLHALVLKHPGLHASNSVWFTPKGYEYLAMQVAEAIEDGLY